MNWYQKIKLAAEVMPIWKAMEVLNLTGQAGKILTREVFRAAYAPLASQFHPDSNPDDPNANSKMVELNNAKDSVMRFLDQPLPSTPQESESPSFSSRERQPEPENFWRQPRRNFTEQDLVELCRKVLQAGMTNAYVHYPYEGYDGFERCGYSTYGSRPQTPQRIPEGMTAEALAGFVKKIIPDFPDSMIDVTFIEREGWVSFTTQPYTGGIRKIRSVSFSKPQPKVKKPAGMGMKPAAVDAHLTTAGLRYAGGGNVYSYYGFTDRGEGYFIRIAKKSVRLVHRVRIERQGLVDGGIGDQVYFGNLTPEILDKWINYIEKKSTQPEATAQSKGMKKMAAFIQPADVPFDFANAVRIIMNDAPNSLDERMDSWEKIGTYPTRQALQWIEMVLKVNGVADLKAEMRWWAVELATPNN